MAIAVGTLCGRYSREIDNKIENSGLISNATKKMITDIITDYDDSERPVLCGLAAAEVLGILSPYETKFSAGDCMFGFYLRYDSQAPLLLWTYTDITNMGVLPNKISTLDINFEGVELTCTSPIETIKYIIDSIIEYDEDEDALYGFSSKYKVELHRRNSEVIDHIASWWYGTHGQSYSKLSLFLNLVQLAEFNRHKDRGIELYNKDKMWYTLMDVLPDPEDSILN